MLLPNVKILTCARLSVAFFVLASVGAAKESKNLPSEPDSLSVRNAHAMAYDTDCAKVLLFGGTDDRSVLGDLWE